jgi:dolichol-phosphate mannosyltransferase
MTPQQMSSAERDSGSLRRSPQPSATSAVVVVPTYNERENLPLLVEGLLKIPRLRILVVDDASPDGTGATADALAAASDGRVMVMHRTGERGLGRAYIDGLRLALTMDTDVICQMDADLSHQPSELPRLLDQSAQADVVIGSRYVAGGSVVNWPLRRRLLSANANRYIRGVCSLRANDCTSGFRCWRREALAAMPLAQIRSEGYAFLVELLFTATALGCTVAEVPITFIERRHGASKLRLRILAESALLPWRLALRTLARRLQPSHSGESLSAPQLPQSDRRTGTSPSLLK